MSKKEQIRDLNKQIEKNKKKNKYIENIEIYKKIIDLNPENINKYLQELGNIYEKNRNFIEAINCYKKIVKTRYTRPKARYFG